MKPNQIIALGKPHVYYLGGPFLICKASSIFNLGCEGEGLWKRCKTCVFVQNFGFVSQPISVKIEILVSEQNCQRELRVND